MRLTDNYYIKHLLSKYASIHAMNIINDIKNFEFFLIFWYLFQFNMK